MKNKKQDSAVTIPFHKLLLSVLSAFVGVQSEKNRKRDFSSGKLSHFIIIGLMMTITFILILVGIVQIVMSSMAT